MGKEFDMIFNDGYKRIFVLYSSTFPNFNWNSKPNYFLLTHLFMPFLLYFYNMQQTDSAQEAKKSKIVTIVRIRPNLRHQDEKQSISLQNQTTLQIEIGGLRRLEKVELALPSETTQRQVFDIVEPLLMKTMEGYNISLLTYGQTGSGKTHTMFGSDWNNIVRSQSPSENDKKQQVTFLRNMQQDQNHAGIIPRSIHLLFQRLITKRRKHIKVYCSFLQLYNQQMADLLQDDPKVAKSQKLLIHENKQDGIYVEGLNEVVVEDPEQCLELMRRGESNRIVRQTHMNAKSSRSHTIFTLLIEEVFPSKKSYRRMKINLCDLAGSEKIHKGETMTGAHFEEMKNINLSLTTLGKVIGALATGNAIPPYRQSKLTRLLQDSLGGNTNTAVIATVTSKISCVEQSLNTLKFLERARQVTGSVIPQVYSQNPEMRNLQREIHYLRDMLKMKGGHIPTDMQLRQRYKHLQMENQKLKEIVDKGLLDKLKKQNIQLKQQLTYQKNDGLLSDSFLQKMPSRTVEHDQSDFSPSLKGMNTISSTGNSHKYQKAHKRDNTLSKRQDAISKKSDERSLAAKTDDLSIQNSTFQRGTGNTIFPSINKGGPRAASKILDRIMQIQRVKQQNKIKLERELQNLQHRSTADRDQFKTSSFKRRH